MSPPATLAPGGKAVADKGNGMTEQWIEIEAPSGTQYFWYYPTSAEQAKYAPWLLDDGRGVIPLLTRGEMDEIPFKVWFVQQEEAYGKRMGDLLWATGPSLKLVSDRFIGALNDMGVTGFKTVPVEIRTLKQDLVQGYQGFVEDMTDTSEVRSTQPDYPGWSFLISRRIYDGLLERGVDEFRAYDAKKDSFVKPSKIPARIDNYGFEPYEEGAE